MPRVFREKVESLAEALQGEQGAADARHHLRGLVRQVVIPANDGPLKLVGNPEKMPTAAGGGNVVAAVGQDGCGARNKLYRRLCWAAA